MHLMEQYLASLLHKRKSDYTEEIPAATVAFLAFQPKTKKRKKNQL